MDRRGITREQVEALLKQPEKVLPIREGRVAVQGLIESRGSDRPYLLRVFVDVDQEPPAVVTAYITSKIDKYGS